MPQAIPTHYRAIAGSHRLASAAAKRLGPADAGEKV